MTSLEDHINQNGVPPGAERLALFRKAMELQGTPELYSQDGISDKIATVKFFDPCSSWTWYATEWDGTNRCFGYVKGHESEWGYFSLRQLALHRGPMGIGIEIDVYFTPQKIPEKELTLPMTSKPNDKLPVITPEIKELLIKYFAAQPPEKPLSEQEFNQVKHLLDRRRGGLIKEAYETIKEDKDLVRSATTPGLSRMVVPPLSNTSSSVRL
jgi:hypothetical protein